MNTKIGLRFTTGHALLVVVLAPPIIWFFTRAQYGWVGEALLALAVVVALVTFRGRRLSGWFVTAIAGLLRLATAPPAPSEPVVGATVEPGDPVAVRWQGGFLFAVIELIPRAFTPTVIVDGKAHTDDVLDTRLLEQLVSDHCPDLEADVVSAGYRVGKTAPADVVSEYTDLIGPDPAPAHRRTWVVLRADPQRTRRSAQRRAAGVEGLARYLVASTTRIADQLASNGVDAVCSPSFDDFDHATDINYKREKWSKIRGKDGSFTVAYTARGGPDAWWSARADRTITRFRVVPGRAPQATVLLTTRRRQRTPWAFSRLSGGQRAALQGQTLFTCRHCQLPIGSAGVLVGQTVDRYPVYFPFDDVDVSINLGDAQTFAQFAVRAAAAGATVTLGPQFRDFAELIGAQAGPAAKVVWPNDATTYFGPHPGTERVMLRNDLIDSPRHHGLPIQRISPLAENRYQMALPRSGEIPEAGEVTSPRRGRKNWLGIAALVVAIIGLMTSPSIVLGILLGFVAVILGFVALGRFKRGQATSGGVAVAGIVLGVLAIIAAGLVFIAVWALGGKDLVDCVNEADFDTAAREVCVDQFQRDLEDRLGGDSKESAAPPSISAPIVRTFS